jgi:serine protease inhibitor
MKIVPLPALICCLILIGCSEDSGNPVSPVRNLTQQESVVVQSYNDFGFDLFREIVKGQDPADNIFISPMSVSYALGMTMNGADGSTYSQMRSVLKFDGLSEQEINESYQSLTALLQSIDANVTMDLANAIWYREGFVVEQELIDKSNTYFGAPVNALDFSAPDAADVINNWVKQQTKGRIESIVDSPIPPYVVMYLLNAIYFKSTWQYKFDKLLTQDATFFGNSGTSTVQTMYLRAELPYFKTSSYRAVELPYGNGSFSMVLILPEENATVNGIIQSLDNEFWNTLSQSLITEEGHVYLPRFTIEENYILNEILQSLGMENAFSGAADFTRINKEGGLFLSEVKHKTWVSVDEEGTEAAAVTSVEVMRGMAGFQFNANKPFIFAIREKNSGSIMFMGVVNNL